MDDYISRQMALNIRFSNAINEDGILYVPLRDFTGGLKALPIADVRENVRSKWQPIEVQPYFKKHFDTSVVCSICHRKGNKRWNFCPNCGADMRGEKQ